MKKCAKSGCRPFCRCKSGVALRMEVSKMRRIGLILILLFMAGPARADVRIIATNIGNGVIQIGYDATGETELVRSFALDIVVTDGNIIDINNFAVGDNNGGYGVFPGAFAGNISVNPTTGQVDSWVGNPNPYTPVAPASYPDALGDIPGPAITIEMGSLYEDPANAPGQTGVLCTITVDENVTSFCVTANAMRGNVILEDGSEAVLVLPDWPDPPCFPNTPEYAIQYANWVAWGKPNCWCGVNGDPPYPNQCYGDINCDTHTRGYVVYTTDLISLADCWKAPIGTTGCACADIDHLCHSRGYCIYTGDLIILSTNWKKKAGPGPDGLPGDCPRPDGGIGI